MIPLFFGTVTLFMSQRFNRSFIHGVDGHDEHAEGNNILHSLHYHCLSFETA